MKCLRWKLIDYGCLDFPAGHRSFAEFPLSAVEGAQDDTAEMRTADGRPMMAGGHDEEGEGIRVEDDVRRIGAVGKSLRIADNTEKPFYVD